MTVSSITALLFSVVPGQRQQKSKPPEAIGSSQSSIKSLKKKHITFNFLND